MFSGYGPPRQPGPYWPLYPFSPLRPQWVVSKRFVEYVEDAADSQILRAGMTAARRDLIKGANVDVFLPTPEDVQVLTQVLPGIVPEAVPWERLRAVLIGMGQAPAELAGYSICDVLAVLKACDSTKSVDDSLKGKGAAPRDDWFLKQYDAVDTDTHHSPATIRTEWNGMRSEDRRAICEGSPSKVSVSAVEKAISRAKKRKNGKMS